MIPKGRRTIMAVMGLMLVTVFSIDLSLALEMEMERKELKPLQAEDIKTLGSKKGGTPAPPPDPQCPIGSTPVGPMTTSTFSRACKVNGQDGTQSCSSKYVKCLGEQPGTPDHAYTENCGPCVALPTQPGQAQTPTGR